MSTTNWKIEQWVARLYAVSKSKTTNKTKHIASIVHCAYDTGKADAKEEIRLALGIEPCSCRNHLPYDS
jgi:hypothetical protein